MTHSLRPQGPRATLSALAVSLLLGAASIPSLSAEEPSWPKAPGAAFALRNANITTPVVAFDTKGRELLAFNCAMRGRSLWSRFYELVCDGGSFHAKDAGPWIGMQVAKSRAFSLEATLTPAQTAPATPGVVLAYGDDKGQDVALIQDKSGLSLRVGENKPTALFSIEAGQSVHVLVTCDKDQWVAYRDGKRVQSGSLATPVAAWGAREFVMGATWSGADAWRGRMESIAVFARALTADEAAGEAAASKALQAGRKPATAVRFKGILVRQARTSTLEEIRPYTRSLTAAEYKVEKVLAGEWKQPTITVLHWMIMDAKRLPIADRKPGVAVELSVEPLAEHPELESNRRDEITDGDLDTVLFYCEAETNP